MKNISQKLKPIVTTAITTPLRRASLGSPTTTKPPQQSTARPTSVGGPPSPLPAQRRDVSYRFSPMELSEPKDGQLPHIVRTGHAQLATSATEREETPGLAQAYGHGPAAGAMFPSRRDYEGVTADGVRYRDKTYEKPPRLFGDEPVMNPEGPRVQEVELGELSPAAASVLKQLGLKVAHHIYERGGLNQANCNHVLLTVLEEHFQLPKQDRPPFMSSQELADILRKAVSEGWSPKADGE
jgi:hypothetical protein